MELRRQERIAYIKIVYCGPPGAGKSTNIGWLHREAKAGRGELLSTALGRDRMLWFDFEPLQPTVFRDFSIRFLIATVPGVVISGAARKHALRGCDSVVFVADSSSKRLYETLSSYRETTHSVDVPLEASAVPIVLQYNKRDAERPLSHAELDEGLNTHRQPVFDAVATRGEGVLETFRAALRETLSSIVPHNEGLHLLRGMAIPDWTDALVQKLFARSSFYVPATSEVAGEEPTGPVVSPAATPARIMHDIATEPVTRKMSLVDFEAALAAAQSKAVASSAPAVEAPAAPSPIVAASEPAESPAAAADAPMAPAVPTPPAAAAPPAPPEAAPATPAAASDAAKYEDLRLAVEAARALVFGASVEATLVPVLARLVGTTSAFTASVLLPAGGDVNVAASHPLNGDPIARRPQAVKLVAALGRGTAALAHEPAANPALADAVRGQGVGTVVSAPLRSPRGLHGILVVYLTEDADPMEQALIEHVGTIANALTLAIRR